MYSLDQQSFMSSNGIRPIFIITPKNAFISGTDTSDHLLQLALLLAEVPKFCVSLTCLVLQ
jgi:hypothetical protein